MNEPTQIPAKEARQGRRGRHMVMVLFASLALAGLVWIGLAVFGESIIPTALISRVSVQTSPIHRSSARGQPGSALRFLFRAHATADQ